MATQTLTTFDALLKNVYRGPIVELLNQETYLIDVLEKQNVNDMGAFTGRQLLPGCAGRAVRVRGRTVVADGPGRPWRAPAPAGHAHGRSHR